MKIEEYKILLEKMDEDKRNQVLYQMEQIGIKVNGFKNLTKAPLSQVAALCRNPKRRSTILTLICDEYKILEILREKDVALEEIEQVKNSENVIGIIAYMILNTGYTDEAQVYLKTLENTNKSETQFSTPLIPEPQSNEKHDKKEERFRKKYLQQVQDNKQLNDLIETYKAQLTVSEEKIDALERTCKELMNEYEKLKYAKLALEEDRLVLLTQLEQIREQLQKKQHEANRKRILLLGTNDIIKSYMKDIDYTFIDTSYDVKTIKKMIKAYNEFWIIQSEINKLSLLRNINKEQDLFDKVRLFANPSHLAEHIQKENNA